MINERRRESLAAWYQLIAAPRINMDVEDQYDELLKAADEMERVGLISASEWRTLVREAGVMFSSAVEGVGGGA